MSRKNVLITLAVILVAGAIVGANLYFRREAGVSVTSASLEQLRQSTETARVQLEQAKQTLTRQQGLWKRQLTTRAELERAENDVKSAESSLQEREKSAKAQDSRIMQERAQLDNAK